jgi:hypothetical protein
MRRRFVLAASAAVLAGILAGGTALAANNPSGSGQPNASCQSVFPTGPLTPAGFNTAGFAQAGTVYAGSGVSVDHAMSTAAVSQYDVACYQVSQH